jgi:hypothetical protein
MYKNMMSCTNWTLSYLVLNWKIIIIKTKTKFGIWSFPK